MLCRSNGEGPLFIQYYECLYEPELVDCFLFWVLLWSGPRYRPFLCLQIFGRRSGRVMGLGRSASSGSGWQWSTGQDSTHGTARIRFAGGCCFIWSFRGMVRWTPTHAKEDVLGGTGRRESLAGIGTNASNPIRMRHGSDLNLVAMSRP